MADEKPDTLIATAVVGTPGADIPALFSNRFYVLVAGDITRLVFSEALGGETINTHTALVMPTTDAADLGRILTETIAKNRAITAKANQTLDPTIAKAATGTVSSDGK